MKESNLTINFANLLQKPTVSITLFIWGHMTYIVISFYYYEYNNKNAIIKENNPVASAKANPKIA